MYIQADFKYDTLSGKVKAGCRPTFQKIDDKRWHLVFHAVGEKKVRKIPVRHVLEIRTGNK